MTNTDRFNKSINRQKVDRIMTYDFVDNTDVLIHHGGYNPEKSYSSDELLEINAKAFKSIGLDVTRYAYDPVNHWMSSKIDNWIRFFGVDRNNWKVGVKGGSAWISERPFNDLSGLEKNMPNMPVYEEVEEWYKPWINGTKKIFDQYDRIFIGAVEGPITDAYTYADMELFSLSIYDAPELISRLLDCTGTFSAHIARVFAENQSAPLQFMGEDIAGSNGPIFSPSFVHKEGLPRWKWISTPIQEKGGKFLFHTDGKYGDFLYNIFDELKADGLNPIERLGCNDVFEIHDQYPDKLLFGNVCCEETLPYGNIYDVEDETLELIEKIGPDGGIFIGSSSEVHELVPIENTETMYRTVHEYGSFPIDIDRIKRRRREIISKLTTRKY
ncbi:MAG: hypothetical protein KAH95_02035 [Spirochaetales bacterium]|nr:hypothetical protein [Spirochaetales bacterium]